jgi:hypothetical protein
MNLHLVREKTKHSLIFKEQVMEEENNRRILLKTGVAMALAGAGATLFQTNTQAMSSHSPSGEHSLENITALMKDAARQAKVELLPEDIAFSVRGDIVVANALIAPPENVRIEEADKIFLLYLSLPVDSDLAKQVPTGFYIVERETYGKNPRAKLVNLEGKSVLEVPLNIIRTELPPERGWAPPLPAKEPVTTAKAVIEQSQVTLYRDVVIEGHGTICYPRDGVWYWIWITIIIFGEP